MAIKEGWTGRVYEDFEVGDIYPHPLGRTVLAADNIWFTLLTQNTNPIHFDTVYAAKTEFGRPLVDSTFTLALVHLWLTVELRALPALPLGPRSMELVRGFGLLHALWLLAVTGTFKYLLATFVIARMLSHGSTAAALIALRRRDGPAPLPIPGGEVIAVLAILACLAIVATASWQAVRDVLIVLAIGLAIRALVRQREVP